MKKIYLFLLFFVYSHGYCQFNITTTDIFTCENNNVSGFDLTQSVVVDANPSDYTISYFSSQTDANLNIYAISNPTSHFVNVGETMFYVRVLKIQTNEIQYTSFGIYVNEPISANPAQLTFCDQTATPIYNLADANAQVIGNQQNVTVTYYDNPISGGNVIVGSTFTQTVFPVQVIGVEVGDALTGCISPRTSITLSTSDCGSIDCVAPTTLSTNSIAQTSAVVLWVANGIRYQIYRVPIGTPAPTPNTTPTGWTNGSYNGCIMGNLTPNTCYAFYVRSECSGGITSAWAGPINFCTQGNCESNGECPDNLSLVAFLDSNTNGIKDSNEVVFTRGSYAYEINNSGNIQNGYPNINYGFHLFDQNPANVYNMSFTINAALLNYYSSTSTYNNIHVTTGGGTQTFYFPITPLAPFSDLEVYMVPFTLPRPGFTYTNQLHFRNNGYENISSGTITFVKDPNVLINSITPAGVAINTANGFTFNFTNLGPNEDRQIDVVMQVPTIPTVSLGQVLTNTVTITPSEGDSFPSNNSDDLSQIVVGSYDPNDKTEKHGGKIAIDEFASSDFLTYTIQFENTGTASAEFVRIEDLLNAQLDLSSVEMISASHPVNMRKINNKLIWNFYNINLPPNISNPSMSHGFVQFKVKPISGFSVGTMIPNTAAIYFDFNPPIFTEVCETEFIATTLSTNSVKANTIALYPNPASTSVSIMKSNGLEKISSINIYDIVGKKVVFHSETESSEVNLDVSVLNNGIYFVEITLENKLKFTKKLVIQ